MQPTEISPRFVSPTFRANANATAGFMTPASFSCTPNALQLELSARAASPSLKTAADDICKDYLSKQGEDIPPWLGPQRAPRAGNWRTLQLLCGFTPCQRPGR